MRVFAACGSCRKFLGALLLGLAVAAPTAHANTPDSVTIPLKLLHVSGLFRLGIDVSIGGAPAKTYLLDTGSEPFFSGYFSGAGWWGNFTDTGLSGNYGYTGGVSYNYEVVTANLTLGGNASATAPNVAIGQIIAQSLNGTVQPQFVTNMQAGLPPLSNAFWGTLGAGLDPAANGLFTILGQMPGNLSTGFIVHTGGRGGSPTLTLGLTDAVRATFPMQVPMEGRNTTLPFPNSNQPTYLLRLLAGQIQLADGKNPYAVVVPVILDTGDPNSVLTQDSHVTVPSSLIKNGSLVTGASFGLSAQGQPGSINWVWNFITGQLVSNNAVNVVPTGGGTLNTGLSPFFSYDVMFDLKNGVIGFKALPPPYVKLTVAGADKITTTKDKITLHGTATASSYVTFVGVGVAGRPFQNATGTAHWTATVPLQMGLNNILVRAHSIDGLTTPTQKIAVRRF